MNSRAQGTIEYLVILAVVVVIGLVVVGLVTTTFNSPAQQLSTATAGIGASTGPISISESVLDPEGSGLITLGNNSGESLAITRVSVGGEDSNYDSVGIAAGQEGTFSIQSLGGACSCVGAAGSTKTCEIVVYASSQYGIEKRYSSSVTVGCVEEALPANPDAVVQPLLLGACGDSNGVSFSSLPSLGLCSNGSASAFAISPSSFDWNCSGSGGAVSCGATRIPGAGTPSDPRMVCTCAELQAIGDYSSSSHALCGDIDCYAATRAGGALYNSGAGFDPFIAYEGTFDGNSHSITGLMIYRPSEIQVGLFGYARRATIRNVGLEDVDITGGASFVGGLIGYNEASPVSNSHVTGKVNAIGGTRVGGLVGYVSYYGGSYTGNITDCYSAADVNASGYVGGLVGFTEYGPTISRSYASGDVNGTTSRVGGLVGDNYTGTITSCYATGDVTGAHTIGGLVGEGYSAASYIYNSYATGRVTSTDTATYSYAGGLIGRMPAFPPIARCFSTGSVTAYYPSGWVGGFAAENGAYLSLSNDYWFDNTGDSAVNCFNNGNNNCTKIDGTNGGIPWFYYDTNGPMSLWGAWSNVSGNKWSTADGTWSICRGQGYPWLTWENRAC